MTVGVLTISPVGLSSSTCCPASPSLPWVREPWFPHLRRYDAIRRLPPASRVAALVARFPIPCLLLSRAWCPSRAHALGGSPRPRQGLWSPGPPCRDYGHGDRWLSHVPELPLCRHAPLLDPGGALSTRPHAPRTLPSGACKPSAFPSVPLERYPTVHDSTHFGAQSRGLPPRSLQLRTPIAGLARGVSLLTCWLGVCQVGLEPLVSPTG